MINTRKISMFLPLFAPLTNDCPHHIIEFYDMIEVNMAKKDTAFFCQNCGHETYQWLGKCPGCNMWNTFVEERVATGAVKRGGGKSKSRKKSDGPKARRLNDVVITVEDRIETGFEELDRVFGGGIVKHSLTLIGGAPGIGKSTITMQVAGRLAKKRRVLYISAEESASQLKMRADRLGVNEDEIFLLTENRFDAILESIQEVKPELVIVDSIQTIYSDELKSTPGSVGQLREVTFQLMHCTKTVGFTTILIGHVTKDGSIAGPKVLEHMVDTVLYFEGDQNNYLRILRSIKNRFGATNEIGIFEMRAQGLLEIKNPSELFVSGSRELSPGNTLIPVMEGTRPIMIEVQALLLKSNFQYPKRTIVGLDVNRINILLAVMDKFLGFNFSFSDIYINVVSGLKVVETASDLGVMAAIISNELGRPLGKEYAFVGEIGLNGEIRGVTFVEQRIKEAAKMGLQAILLPKSNVPREKLADIKIIPIGRVDELLSWIRDQ